MGLTLKKICCPSFTGKCFKCGRKLVAGESRVVYTGDFKKKGLKYKSQAKQLCLDCKQKGR